MAALSSISPLRSFSLCEANPMRVPNCAKPVIHTPSRNHVFRSCVAFGSSGHLTLEKRHTQWLRQCRELRKARSAEEETAVTEERQQEEEAASPSASDEQQPTVAVPVSPSDKLTMFFQAEGTITETAIPTVTKALEGTEGVTNLKVQISEGIASVELAKQTTIQATGVASSLVETIQGAGFKLQTLNLSFEEEEEEMTV